MRKLEKKEKKETNPPHTKNPLSPPNLPKTPHPHPNNSSPSATTTTEPPPPVPNNTPTAASIAGSPPAAADAATNALDRALSPAANSDEGTFSHHPSSPLRTKEKRLKMNGRVGSNPTEQQTCPEASLWAAEAEEAARRGLQRLLQLARDENARDPARTVAEVRFPPPPLLLFSSFGFSATMCGLLLTGRGRL